MKENKNKKKIQYANVSLLMFVLFAAAGCFTSIMLYQLLYVNTYVDEINIYAFNIITLLAGFFTSVSLYYIGKLIIGKMAGYRFVSFNFWFLNFIKNQEGKIICKLGGIKGLGCQLHMAPNKEKPNYVLYLLGGLIFTLPIFLVVMIVSSFISQQSDLKYYLIFIFGFIPFVTLGNLVPVRYDSNNDGFLLRLIHKDGTPDNYHTNLKQYEALVNGKSELVYQEIDTPHTPFDLEALYYNYYYLIDRNEYTRALQTSELLIANSANITEYSMVYLGYAGKIYELCRQKRFEESDRFFWELKHDIRSVVRNKNNFESIKICLYVAAYMESNYDEYLNLYYKKDRLSKRYVYLSRVDKEVQIINDTIKSIQEDHKDWFVE